MTTAYQSGIVEVGSNKRKIHYVEAGPAAESGLTPVVAVHGLGGTSSYWLPLFNAAKLADKRRVIAYDFDGHGPRSEFSGKMSISSLVQDMKDVIDGLGLQKVVLMVHSMNGMVGSIFAKENPDKVEKLILVHPVRNFGDAGRQGMRDRAKLATTDRFGMTKVANAVAAGAVAKSCHSDNPTGVAFIRHLVSATQPEAYAAACLALADSPIIDGKDIKCEVALIGGEEDYLCSPDAAKAWVAEIPDGKGSLTVLKSVGHWGAIEKPQALADALQQYLSPSKYHILLGTFRSPYLYTLSFDTRPSKLELLHTNEAVGGHSWLDLSPDQKTLYTTCWTTPASVASYSIVAPSGNTSYPTLKLQAKIPSKNLSGYVCSNGKAMYSACGPQVDVFLVDEQTGALKDEPAVQSFALVSEADMHKGNSQMDFGGLRHGGHSCDLSPDGKKLYVADIGRNCVWMYHVDTKTGLLKEASKNIAKRGHDGPRHAWPHPNGKIVYSLQEHSSYVDVLELTEDDQRLEWLEGVDILPEGGDCHLFWADEVRLSPNADTLFGSTRGLEPQTKGYVAAWDLLPNGRLARPSQDAKHRIETRTSGGWANAIAACPTLGPNGEVFLTLTDSEEGFIQILSYTKDAGFKVVDEVRLGTKEEKVGASVAVWL